MYCNSTAFSANNLRYHFDHPIGGMLQQRAMIFSSTSLVILVPLAVFFAFFWKYAPSKPTKQNIFALRSVHCQAYLDPQA